MTTRLFSDTFDPTGQSQNSIVNDTGGVVTPGIANLSVTRTLTNLSGAGTTTISTATTTQTVLQIQGGVNTTGSYRVTYNFLISGVPTTLNFSGMILTLAGTSITGSQFGFATLTLPGTTYTSTVIINSSTPTNIPFAQVPLGSPNANQIQIDFDMSNSLSPWVLTVLNLTSVFACFAADTEVLMADGSIKTIENLERGDEIAGDLDISRVHKIAQILKNTCTRDTKLDLVKIEKDSLGENYPYRDTLCTGFHPILYNNERKPAKCFQKFKGVEFLPENISAGEILPPDSESDADNQSYTLYNIQYDHEGFFIANGLIVQTVSPHSNLLPLHPDLFFDKNNIDKPLTWESYHYDTIWDESVLEPTN